MKSVLHYNHVDAEVCDRLRAFSLFFRHGYETAVSIYPEQAEFLLRNKDKSMDEVLRYCFQACEKNGESSIQN